MSSCRQVFTIKLLDQSLSLLIANNIRVMFSGNKIIDLNTKLSFRVPYRKGQNWTKTAARRSI